MVKKIILITLIVLFVAIALFCGKLAETIYARHDIHHIICNINRGDTGRDIAEKLYLSGVVSDKDIFYYLIRLKDEDRNLKAGHYLFSGNLNMLDVLAKLVTGETLVERVTIPEGLSKYRTFKTISDRGIGEYDRFLKKARDIDFVREVTGFEVNTLEGFLYPDTYVFGLYMTEENIIRMMVKNFYDRLQQAHIAIEDQNQFYRNLTLASIVEREAIFNDEKPLIAGVYFNRLHIGMRLQADPTVVYHLEPEFRHIPLITYRMTRYETPYNTYVIPGLPPQPICSPAISSIFAVKNPEPSPYFFFFADRRGRHIFSVTYQDHLRKQNERNREERANQNQSAMLQIPL